MHPCQVERAVKTNETIQYTTCSKNHLHHGLSMEDSPLQGILNCVSVVVFWALRSFFFVSDPPPPPLRAAPLVVVLCFNISRPSCWKKSWCYVHLRCFVVWLGEGVGSERVMRNVADSGVPAPSFCADNKFALLVFFYSRFCRRSCRCSWGCFCGRPTEIGMVVFEQRH